MSLISVGLNSAGKWISRAIFEYHYSRRKYDALRAGGLKTFEQDDVYIFLYLKILSFHLVLPFRSYKIYLHVSQKEK